jgi:polyhydroxybutyrate depolymerase
MRVRLRRVALWLGILALGVPVSLVVALALFLRALNPLVLGAPREPMRTLVSGGARREFLLHVPPGHRRGEPVPLVVVLHGADLWPSTQRRISPFDALADREGFVVAYPCGIPLRPLPLLPALPVWPMGPHRALAADVGFVADLIAALEREDDVDPRRVYVAGFSNGGGMAFALSCTLADRIAAVGTVAAAQALPWSWCPDRRPVPMIAFHGTADRLVPYGGGRSRAAPTALPAVEARAALWAGRNGCAPTAETTRVAADVTRRAYTGCADDAGVELYTIDGGGHTWPGGGPMPAWMVGATTRSVDATALMWNFFHAHPLVAVASPGHAAALSSSRP